MDTTNSKFIPKSRENSKFSNWLGKEYTSNSINDTFQLAEDLAPDLKPGDILCLDGSLGAGKTHFVKGLAKALGIDPKTVHSPTFTLIHEYLSGKIPLYHFDFYRLKNWQEALDIGVEEYFWSDGISCIEWPDRITPILPSDALWLQIDSITANTRKIFFRKGIRPGGEYMREG